MKKYIIHARLRSPSSKMVRAMVFAAWSFLLSGTAASLEEFTLTPPGKTADIPFAPVKEAVATRLKAAQADDAEIYLSQWAPVG